MVQLLNTLPALMNLSRAPGYTKIQKVVEILVLINVASILKIRTIAVENNVREYIYNRPPIMPPVGMT